MSEDDAVLMASEHDDLLGAEALGGDDTAEADRAIANNGGGVARCDARRTRGVMAGAHHIRKRQQRRHQRLVHIDRQPDEGAVGLRDADRLALPAVEVAAPPAAVQARRLQAFMAEDTRAV